MSCQFYCYFYIDKEFVTTSLLISSTDLTSSILPSLSGSIVSPTSSVTLAKTKSDDHTIHYSQFL